MKKRKNKQTDIGIGAEGVIKISETLKVNTTLTKLYLQGDEQEYKWKREGNENEWNKWTGNKIGAEGASKISETLKVNTTLTILYLSDDEQE